MAQLPLYYKNGKPVGPPVKRWKENYLFLLVFVAFVVLLAGNLWLVPESGESSTEYSKFNPSGVLSSLTLEPSLATLIEPPDDERNLDFRTLNGVPPNASNPKLGIVVVEVDDSSPKSDGVEQGQQGSPNPTPDIGQHSDVVGGNGNTDDPKSPDTHPTSTSSQPPPAAAGPVPEQRRREIVEVSNVQRGRQCHPCVR